MPIDNNDELLSRATSHPLGKCTEPLKTAVPEELRDEFNALAVLHGKTSAEYLRDLVFEHVYGRLSAIRLANRAARGRAD